jgi:thiosulfate reductase cytochrome b subunit
MATVHAIVFNGAKFPRLRRRHHCVMVLGRWWSRRLRQPHFRLFWAGAFSRVASNATSQSSKCRAQTQLPATTVNTVSTSQYSLCPYTVLSWAIVLFFSRTFPNTLRCGLWYALPRGHIEHAACSFPLTTWALLYNTVSNTLPKTKH